MTPKFQGHKNIVNMGTHSFCRDLCIARGEPIVGAGEVSARYVLLHWPRAHWRVPRINALNMPEVLSSAIIVASEAGIHVALVDGDNIAISCGPEMLIDATPEMAAEAILRLSRNEPLANSDMIAMDHRPTILCCTDSKMDACCARYGFATWKALKSAADPNVFRVLQSTHIGGCRFAASLLVLPQRERYGRLTPDHVPDFLASLRAGEPYLPAWRGEPSLEAVAQVADYHTRSYAQKMGLAAQPVLERIARDTEHAAEFIATIGATRLHIVLKQENYEINIRCRTISDDAEPERAARWRLASMTVM